ncbi:MAG: GNAT family N-acetyltransferase [Propionibacteriales bacterium]|nr:GNAT family N-acetyltransferase [Propionibacteriales bacterium]
MPYYVRPLTADHGQQIALWRYPGPWAIYDLSGPLDPAEGYWAVVDDEDALVGFACFGVEARVPGLDERSGVLDVGVGMRPELTGHGRGREFSEAVLAHGRDHTSARRLRAVVQDWNARSIRLLDGLGFARVDTLDVPTQGKTYVVMERAV